MSTPERSIKVNPLSKGTATALLIGDKEVARLSSRWNTNHTISLFLAAMMFNMEEKLLKKFDNLGKEFETFNHRLATIEHDLEALKYAPPVVGGSEYLKAKQNFEQNQKLNSKNL